MHEANLRPVVGNRVWCGPDLAEREEDWTYRLTADDIDVLDDAFSCIAARDFDVLEITRDLFPLPGLGDTLKRIEVDLLKSFGFKMIRGIPVARYNIRESAISYFRIGSHLGEAVSQNAAGHALGHICNLGFDP